MTELMVGPFYQDGFKRSLTHTNAGPPTSGTSGSFAGYANPGALLIDETNGILYQNTGTRASPTWSLMVTNSVTDNIASGATQTQTGATQLTTNINDVVTNGVAGNGVRLQPSAAGMEITVSNSSANALQVYGTSPDTINGVATATGVSVPAGKTAIFVCFTAGAWRMLLSA
jgi:hypothetical protein